MQKQQLASRRWLKNSLIMFILFLSTLTYFNYSSWGCLLVDPRNINYLGELEFDDNSLGSTLPSFAPMAPSDPRYSLATTYDIITSTLQERPGQTSRISNDHWWMRPWKMAYPVRFPRDDLHVSCFGWFSMIKTLFLSYYWRKIYGSKVQGMNPTWQHGAYESCQIWMVCFSLWFLDAWMVVSLVTIDTQRKPSFKFYALSSLCVPVVCGPDCIPPRMGLTRNGLPREFNGLPSVLVGQLQFLDTTRFLKNQTVGTSLGWWVSTHPQLRTNFLCTSTEVIIPF